MSVHIPRKGKHAHLVETAMENARFRLERESQTRERALQELQQSLGLRYPPRRIEGFDIAHLSGKQTVASLVTFLEGQPRKGGYRHYHIRSLHGRIDDFESMREAVARRYTRQLNENRELPDLILIDGGKGQVSAAESMLKALEIQEVPLVGLAKKNEELYLPGRAEPLRLPRSSEALHILQAVRDEAHRFATTFHKRVRAAQLNTSVLESIPGIGRKRSVALLTAFGSLAGILAGEPEQIARAGRLGLDKAKELLAALRALQERK
jgi:excinuclease ABC subunit C